MLVVEAGCAAYGLRPAFFKRPAECGRFRISLVQCL
jgi:hypothetical protein